MCKDVQNLIKQLRSVLFGENRNRFGRQEAFLNITDLRNTLYLYAKSDGGNLQTDSYCTSQSGFSGIVKIRVNNKAFLSAN